MSGARLAQAALVPLAALAALATLATSSGCVRPRVAGPGGAEIARRLSAADDRLLAGCFDCLADALREYEAIAALPRVSAAAADAAATGALRAVLLLALRERELEFADQEYLPRARALVAARSDRDAVFLPLLDAIESLPPRLAQFDRNDETAGRQRAFRDALPSFLETRRSGADADPLSAYAWVAFTCAYGRDDRAQETLLAPLVRLRSAPLIVYRAATCVETDRTALEETLRREPEFSEVNYWLGQDAAGRLQLGEAETRLLRAYTWRGRWPALTAALANVYGALEEPDRALEFYDQTLALAPGVPEALIGRVRSLSLLGRHDEAFQAIDAMLSDAVRVLPGEAYYWRAWNDLQVGRLEEAWRDIEAATPLWVNSEVAKLGGLVAYRRGDLATAVSRFETARELTPGDCGSAYYLGIVHAERREWPAMAEVFAAAAECLEVAQDALRDDVGRLRALPVADRTARWLASRESQLVETERQLATSWFNAAVAFFNTSRQDEARLYAGKVAEDAEYAERARELIERLEGR